MLDEREEKGLAAKIAAVEEVPTIPAMFVCELCVSVSLSSWNGCVLVASSFLLLWSR